MPSAAMVSQQRRFREQFDHRVEDAGDDAGHHGAERRHQEPRVDLGELLRERTVGAHRQHRARGGQEGGLQAGHRRRQHRQVHQQPAPVAQHRVGQRAEHVVGVLLVAQTQPGVADPGVHHHRHRHQQVGQQDADDAQQAGPSRRPGGVLALLAERQAGVPAPEREDRPDDADDEGAERQPGERVEPVEVEAQARRRVTGADVDECRDRRRPAAPPSGTRPARTARARWW